MHAMQYEITLPADYDMGIVRERVATKGHLLDELPGLGFKAYLVREKGVAGSPVNAYAPFYLWSEPAALTGFLLGPGFRGLSADFGRPTVRHWTGLALVDGVAAGGSVRTAVRRQEYLPRDADPAEAVEATFKEAEREARLPGAVGTVLALDPDRWELVRLALWNREDPPTGGDRFRVLHLSAPELAALPREPQW
ncbi:DUF4865 family protein [Streptomyces sp. NPDC002851]